MDFYLSFFDDKYKLPEDEPSIGILLCSEKDKVVAKYSALARNENLRAAQYFTYLPTEEELAKVLSRNRAEFEEREVYDLMGIVFTGHPDLRRVFHADDFVGHPLRKDFVPPPPPDVPCFRKEES